VSWFFADVQQSLRIGLFSLVSYHRCSPLFAWVGVSRRRLQTTKNRSRTGFSLRVSRLAAVLRVFEPNFSNVFSTVSESS
jgi:hypothetical protein